MYCLVTFDKIGRVIPNLTLCQAYRQLCAIGRGAIFRNNPQPRDKPIYPFPRR